MDNQELFGQDGQKRSDIQVGEGINEEVTAIEGELDEADFFVVVVKAIGLGVECDAIEGAQTLKKFGHAGRIGDIRERMFNGAAVSGLGGWRIQLYDPSSLLGTSFL